MIPTDSLTRKLAFSDSDIFEELKSNFLQARKIEFSLNLLISLLEESLPHYFLDDLPNHAGLLKNRKALKRKALKFLCNESETLLNLLYKDSLEAQQEDIFYLLARYLPLCNDAKKLLNLGIIALDFAISNRSGDLPLQALCRYDLVCLVKKGYDSKFECKKEPYKEILELLTKPQDEFAYLYLLLSRNGRMLYLKDHDRLPPFNQDIIDDLLNSLLLLNRQALKLALTTCAKRLTP